VSHPSARLTVHGRLALVQRVESGWTVRNMLLRRATTALTSSAAPPVLAITPFTVGPAAIARTPWATVTATNAIEYLRLLDALVRRLA
jgi:hypothetical protein